jgi:hypothetical protein
MVEIIRLLLVELWVMTVGLVVELENIRMVTEVVEVETLLLLVHLKEMTVEILMLLVNLHQEPKALLLEVVELVQLVETLLGMLLMRK